MAWCVCPLLDVGREGRSFESSIGNLAVITVEKEGLLRLRGCLGLSWHIFEKSWTDFGI